MSPRTHQCWFDLCDRQVAPEMLMCSQHWSRLPKPLRDAVWSAYRGPGPLSPEWWDAVEAANDYLLQRAETSA